MIQLLTYYGNEQQLIGKDVAINRLHDAQSMDEFDINVIDLSNINIWEYDGSDNSGINCINDFKSLNTMMSSSQKSNIVIIFPQNILYKYHKAYQSSSNSYKLDSRCELKDMISKMNKQILSYLSSSITDLSIFYENTRTLINNCEVCASFSFNDILSEYVLTKSLKSDRPTTIKQSEIILTTLNISSYEELIGFLSTIKLIKEKEQTPDWIKEEKMFDDEMQLNIIEKNTSLIKKADDNIEKAKDVLFRNERYKSTLYTSGDELVSVVFDVLEKMLGWDLKSFDDIKEEDFIADCDNNIFIGEIKGITSNVKNANVSQLDNHVQNYIDNHEVDVNHITALLIINHQRNRPLSNREAVNQNTIALSKRNGSLIVDTITLLKMFEKYLSEELTREECVELLTNNVGLLTLN